MPTHSHTGNINTKNLSGTFISKSVERDSSGIVSNISTNKVGNSSGGSGNTGTEYTINASHTHTIVINNILDYSIDFYCGQMFWRQYSYIIIEPAFATFNDSASPFIGMYILALHLSNKLSETPLASLPKIIAQS